MNLPGTRKTLIALIALTAFFFALFLTGATLFAQGADDALPELDQARAEKVMDKDTMIYWETYGTGANAVKETDFFDTLSRNSPANPVQCKVVGNELIIEPAEMDPLKGAILPFGQKIVFPMTMDIKFRTEMDPAGSIVLNVCANKKTGSFAIKGNKTIASGPETLSLDTGEVHTLRFVFDEQGRARVYALEQGGSIPLVRGDLNAAYTSLDLRIYGAKLYVQDIKVYSRIP